MIFQMILQETVRHIIRSLCFGAGLLCFLGQMAIALPEQTVLYSYLGNHRAELFLNESSSGAQPVLLYVPDELFFWMDVKNKQTLGLNAAAFADEFSRWGMATMVISGTASKQHALKGALEYIKNHPKLDERNVYVYAVSESAVVAIKGLQKGLAIRKLIIANPYSRNKEYLLQHIKNHKQPTETPIFFMFGTDVSGTYVRPAFQLRKYLQRFTAQFWYKEYHQNKKWFWNPSLGYITDMYRFIFQEPYPFDHDVNEVEI